MYLVERLFDIIKLFIATFACVVPCAFGVGMIVSLSLVLLLGLIQPGFREKPKSSVEFLNQWYEWLVSAFVGGFASFPITRFVNGSPLTFWNYLVVTAGLFCFALIMPLMAGKTLRGASGEEMDGNLYFLWTGLTLGGLAGALSMWFWFE